MWLTVCCWVLRCKVASAWALHVAHGLLLVCRLRYKEQGGTIVLQGDSTVVVGPQWVFISSLKFNMASDHSQVQVQSPHLYSSITSNIYPGNMYCKLLSPARVVEFMQTTGLRNRYK